MELARLKKLKLSPRPIGQRLFADTILRTGFTNPLRPTKIQIENFDRLPKSTGSFIVMNHTDRYTCWPFQYYLHREHGRYTSTWVKAKYYQNPAMAWILDRFNNIPIPSLGYLIVKDFETATGHPPSPTEYEILKRFADGTTDEESLQKQLILDRSKTSHGLMLTLGSGRNPGAEHWRKSVRDRFDELMSEVVRLNREALATGLDIMIFPEGTRHKRLGHGFTGAAQMILATGATVVPIGASGIDRLFPGGSPFSRGGTAKFRIGTPLRPGHELKPFEDGPAFVPFTPDARLQEHRFRGLTELMMDRINELLDPEYQRVADGVAKTGASRFI